MFQGLNNLPWLQDPPTNNACTLRLLEEESIRKLRLNSWAEARNEVRKLCHQRTKTRSPGLLTKGETSTFVVERNTLSRFLRKQRQTEASCHSRQQAVTEKRRVSRLVSSPELQLPANETGLPRLMGVRAIAPSFQGTEDIL